MDNGTEILYNFAIVRKDGQYQIYENNGSLIIDNPRATFAKLEDLIKFINSTSLGYITYCNGENGVYEYDIFMR